MNTTFSQICTKKPKKISKIRCCHNLKICQKKMLIMNVYSLNIINCLRAEDLVIDGITFAHDK
jgi:hypothetical protein